MTTSALNGGDNAEAQGTEVNPSDYCPEDYEPYVSPLDGKRHRYFPDF